MQNKHKYLVVFDMCVAPYGGMAVCVTEDEMRIARRNGPDTSRGRG